MEKTKKEIEAILQKDEVMVFEEYKRIPTFEEKASALRKESEDISGENLTLNSEILQQ